MHFGFLSGLYTKPAFSPATSVALSQHNNAAYQTVPGKNKKSAHDQNKPSLRGTLRVRVRWHTKDVKNIRDTEGWSWTQQFFFKLRTWLLSADNVIHFAPNWAPFMVAAMVTRSESRHANRYQFLPRPRLTGRHAISSISDTKCWIVKAKQQGTASSVRHHSICAGWMCGEAFRKQANPQCDAVAGLGLILS